MTSMRLSDYEQYGELQSAIHDLVVKVVEAHCGDQICLTYGTDANNDPYPTDMKAYHAFYDKDIGLRETNALASMLSEAYFAGKRDGERELQHEIKTLLNIEDPDD